MNWFVTEDEIKRMRSCIGPGGMSLKEDREVFRHNQDEKGRLAMWWNTPDDATPAKPAAVPVVPTKS